MFQITNYGSVIQPDIYVTYNPMIPFLDLKKINDSFEPELSNAIKRVLDSGWYLLGEEVNCV